MFSNLTLSKLHVGQGMIKVNNKKIVDIPKLKLHLFKLTVGSGPFLSDNRFEERGFELAHSIESFEKY